MSNKVNTFNPNSPVNPGMFVGRIDETNRLEQALIQTRAGNPGHFMLTGERGIGKSSLLLWLKYAAEGRVAINGERLKFLIVDGDVDNETTQNGLVKRIQLALDRQLGVTEAAKSFLSDSWKFLQRVRVMETGLEQAPEKAQSDEVMLDEFAFSLGNIAKRTAEASETSMFSAKYDGILILIDEADNCSGILNLGSFLKLLLERLQRADCTRVLVGLAGLPNLRNRLHTSHPSALRIFEELALSRLSDDEVSRVIDSCLNKANEQNEQKTSVDEAARKLLISFSEGYPHFIQQFGYSAFAADTDGVITQADFVQGAFGERGALELIGNRYYRDDFYNKIQSDGARQVLRIMADDLDGWVTKQKIAAKFKGKETILTNALKTLRDRKIILDKEGTRGTYRLQHKGFALWIKLNTKAQAESGTGESPKPAASESGG